MAKAPTSTPIDPWRDPQLIRANAHLSNYELADRFGGTEFVYRKARKKFGIPNFKDVEAPIVGDDIDSDMETGEMSVEDQVERDVTVIRLRQELADTKAKLAVALNDMVLHERIALQAQQHLPRLEPVCVPSIIKTRDTKTTESAVLAWADWHGDEIVSEEIMEGLNSYNPYIVTRRVETMIDSTLSLMFDHHSGTRFDEIVVLDVGDGITGALHEENKFTNAMPPFLASVMIAEIKARALMDLAANVEKVRFFGVPGNHWRYTKNVSWKMPTETSDWLIYTMMAMRVENQPNIEMNIPQAWSKVVDIKGHGFSLNHGYTDAKGGFGGISWYSQQRADAKRTAIDQRLGRHVDYRVYGHIHNEAVIGRIGKGQIITVPSLKGGDEYAKEGMAGSYSDPGQMLWGVHAERGKTWAYSPLTVNHSDDADECRYDIAIPANMRLL